MQFLYPYRQSILRYPQSSTPTCEKSCISHITIAYPKTQRYFSRLSMWKMSIQDSVVRRIIWNIRWIWLCWQSHQMYLIFAWIPSNRWRRWLEKALRIFKRRKITILVVARHFNIVIIICIKELWIQERNQSHTM